MASTDVELQQQLKEAGKRLSHPPDSVDELLPVLDQVEKLLSKVDQSPKKSMLDALKPSMKALIQDNLSKHSDTDVKVAVASCISEITRITAPDAPYNDNQMKDVFQLIVSSFEGLADQSSRSYIKRASILETVSKVRSCVIMLDLECDALIVEMFEHFIKSVRDYHHESIFSSMENIMVLVLEESEEIPVEMLKPLLASVKKDHAGVLPVARKLGEGVFLKSAEKLKPYLLPAIKSLGESLDTYTKVVTSVCEGTTATFENNDENNRGADESKVTTASSDHTDQVVREEVEPAVDRSPKSVMSNGVNEAANEKASVDQESKKPEEEDTPLNKEDTEDSDTKKLATEEPSDSSHVEGEKENDVVEDSENEKDKEAENEKDSDVQVSSPKGIDSKHAATANVSSPSQSNSLPEDSRKKQVPQEEDTPEEQKEIETVNESEGGEATSDSDAKPVKKSKAKSKSKSTKQSGKKSKQSGKKVDVKEEKSKITFEESDSENKPSVKKSSPKKKDTGKKRGNVKNATEAKSLTDDDDDEMDSSPKSSAKGEGNSKETPVTSAKRKRTPVTDNASDTIKYDESLVGTKVKVWWPEDKMYYEGVVEKFYPAKKKHKVSYLDGDEETLNLKTQRWEILQEFTIRDNKDQTTEAQSDEEASPGTHKKKKSKTDNAPSGSQEKIKDSVKRVGKSKKENSGAKSKEDEETSKASTKNKTVNHKSKGKSPQSGSKSNTKAKSGSSNVKETDPESGKGKSTETVKSGSKSGKKRKKRS